MEAGLDRRRHNRAHIMVPDPRFIVLRLGRGIGIRARAALQMPFRRREIVEGDLSVRIKDPDERMDLDVAERFGAERSLSCPRTALPRSWRTGSHEARRHDRLRLSGC